MWFGSFVSTILADAENQLNTVIHFLADSDERAHYRSLQISHDGRQEHRGGRGVGEGGGIVSIQCCHIAHRGVSVLLYSYWSHPILA